MQIIINLILIQIIAVVLVDISGAPQSFEAALAKWVGVRKVSIHLINCSFCVSHHLMVLYLLCTWQLSLAHYACVLLLATFTPVTGDLILTAVDACERAIQAVQYFLNR